MIDSGQVGEIGCLHPSTRVTRLLAKLAAEAAREHPILPASLPAEITNRTDAQLFMRCAHCGGRLKRSKRRHCDYECRLCGCLALAPSKWRFAQRREKRRMICRYCGRDFRDVRGYDVCGLCESRVLAWAKDQYHQGMAALASSSRPVAHVT